MKKIFTLGTALTAAAVGVGSYLAVKKNREGGLRDGFTVTAHTGAFHTPNNTLESVRASIDNQVKVMEIDIRKRPDGTLVMNHDEPETNEEGVPLNEAFELLNGTGIMLNLDIKDTAVLDDLYDLLEKSSLLDYAFMTGILKGDVPAVKASKCSVLPYYLNANLEGVRHLVRDKEYTKGLLNDLKESGAVGYNIKFIYATKALSFILHQNGYKLSVWTCNERVVIESILAMHPDNITTQEYDLVQEVISKN